MTPEFFWSVAALGLSAAFLYNTTNNIRDSKQKERQSQTLKDRYTGDEEMQWRGMEQRWRSLVDKRLILANSAMNFAILVVILMALSWMSDVFAVHQQILSEVEALKMRPPPIGCGPDARPESDLTHFERIALTLKRADLNEECRVYMVKLAKGRWPWPNPIEVLVAMISRIVFTPLSTLLTMLSETIAMCATMLNLSWYVTLPLLIGGLWLSVKFQISRSLMGFLTAILNQRTRTEDRPIGLQRALEPAPMVSEFQVMEPYKRAIPTPAGTQWYYETVIEQH